MQTFTPMCTDLDLFIIIGNAVHLLRYEKIREFLDI